MRHSIHANLQIQMDMHMRTDGHAHRRTCVQTDMLTDGHAHRWTCSQMDMRTDGHDEHACSAAAPEASWLAAVSMTPLGSPVVPLVYSTVERSLGLQHARTHGCISMGHLWVAQELIRHKKVCANRSS
jgi:hypothetical protein